MKSPEFKHHLRKTVLSSTLAALIPVSNALADTYVWGTLTASAADPTTCAASSDAMDVTFTMVNPSASLLVNSDSADAAGTQTATCGTLTYNTETQSATAEIVAFSFFGSGLAAAQAVTVDLLQSPNDLDVGNLFLANMLFNWNGNNGIPVSLVWDAQGLMAEMDGTPTSFTLNADGSIVGGKGAVYSEGAIPFTDGSIFFSFGGTDYYLGLGTSPLAMRSENTPNITVSSTECQSGVDDVYTNNTGGGCMGITPSADVNQPVIEDLVVNTTTSQTGFGIGGSPMMDGPFGGFNANFDVTTVTLVSFIDTTAPTITASGSQGTSIVVPLNGTYVEDGATCVDAAPLGTNLDAAVVTTVTYSADDTSYAAAGGNAVDETTAGYYKVTYTCSDTAIDSVGADAFNAATPVVRTVIVNTTPAANADYDQSLASDSPLTIDFATTDITGSDLIATDADGDTMIFSSVGVTANGGVVTGNGTGSLEYTPAAGYVGADSFTYTVNDGYIDSAPGTVNLTVTNVLPVAVVDGDSALTDETIAIDVISNDSDYEDDINGSLATLFTSVQIVTSPTFGSILNVTGGTINYTAPSTIPVGDEDTFTYTVTDSNGGVSTPATTVTVTILAAPNTAPVGADVSYSTDAGTPLDIVIDAVSGDGSTLPAIDGDGDTLIFTNVTSPTTNGTVTGNNSGTLTYTPNAGYNGPDSFTFTADDSKGGVSTAKTISITVNNELPVAVNDDVSMLLGDGTLNISVLDNDTDLEDDLNGDRTLMVVTPATPSHGTAVVGAVNAGGEVTIDYTPTTVGVHTFDYTVTDSDTGDSTTPATVTVTVTAIPVTADTPLSTDEDVPLTTITAASLASDADLDSLTFATFDAASTQGGEVTVNAGNDTLTYTPAADFNGTDTFTFSVTDSVNTSVTTSTVTMTVNSVDDVMVCQGTTVTTAVDTVLEITADTLIGTCTDIDGTVSIVSYTQPTNGAITGAVTGPLTYTPTASFAGPDSFTFTATDGAGGVGDKTYTVNIVVSNAAAAATHIISGSNFTMIDPGGSTIGGATDVSGVFDERLICSAETCTDFAMTTALASSQPFQSNLWTAHHIRVFGPGSYTFDSSCSGTDITAGTTDCGGTAPLTLVVADGQLGAHMLFDWGITSDIDVAVLWNYNASFGDLIYDGGCASGGADCVATQTPTKQWNWVSIDGDSNGKPGIPMVDGPFGGFRANFNLDMTTGYTPPLANDDNTSTTPSLLVTIDLLANDVDAEDGAPPVGAVVTLDTTATAAGSVLVDNLDGTVNYTPDATLVDGDTDTFTYTITDAGGAVSNVATVTITITATINTAPVANDVAFGSDEDATLDIDITSVDTASVAVASDGELDILTFATFDAATTNGGTVTVDTTNSILTYTPPGDFNGTDTFTFSVNDGLADSNVATVTLTINPTNDPVICTTVVLATGADTPLMISTADLIAGCSDIDTGDTVSFISAAQPENANSSVADDGAGTLTYTPETGFIGSDSFIFTASDGNSGDGTAVVAIQVGTVYGNFTMLDKSGNVFGGTNDVVFDWDGSALTSDAETTFNMTIESEGPHPFFGAPWFAHHVRVFGPGTYSFEADNTLCQSKATTPDAANASTQTIHAGADDIEVTGCAGTGTPTTITMTIGTGQVGVHMLFDYNGSFDIDVVNLYDINAVWEDATGQGDQLNDLYTLAAGAAPDPTTDWALVSRDVNGDGINGSPMVDGPFLGFYANFNSEPGGTAAAAPDITSEAKDTKLGGGAIGLAVLLSMLPLLVLFRRRNQ